MAVVIKLLDNSAAVVGDGKVVLIIHSHTDHLFSRVYLLPERDALSDGKRICRRQLSSHSSLFANQQ
jgi:hypothetical protein